MRLLFLCIGLAVGMLIVKPNEQVVAGQLCQYGSFVPPGFISDGTAINMQAPGPLCTESSNDVYNVIDLTVSYLTIVERLETLWRLRDGVTGYKTGFFDVSAPYADIPEAPNARRIMWGWLRDFDDRVKILKCAEEPMDTRWCLYTIVVDDDWRVYGKTKGLLMDLPHPQLGWDVRGRQFIPFLTNGVVQGRR